MDSTVVDKNSEIEKKYRLNESWKKRITQDLKELGAEFLASDFEQNLIFGSEHLKAQKSVIRIRITQDQKILTFKKFVSSADGIKTHIEHETNISDASEMEQILSGLGIHKKLYYEKKRKTYRLRNALVMIDQLPFGNYLEIEASQQEIAQVELLLGADELEVEPSTYPSLTHKLGVLNGKILEARFE